MSLVLLCLFSLRNIGLGLRYRNSDLWTNNYQIGDDFNIVFNHFRQSLSNALYMKSSSLRLMVFKPFPALSTFSILNLESIFATLNRLRSLCYNN